MVLAGEFLERATLIRREIPGHDPVTLEGLFHRGAQAPGIVICAPHPRMGGSMDSPVVSELAWALTRSGRATLRFNYQGVGASPGDLQLQGLDEGAVRAASIDAVTSQIEDARAAVNHLRATVEHGKVAIAGYSFGAAVALGLALEDPAITHLVLIAPPTGLFDFGPIAKVKRRTLIVAGHQDPWVDRPRLAELVAGREGATWEVIPGADHTFSRGLTELGRTVVSWFEAGREGPGIEE